MYDSGEEDEDLRKELLEDVLQSSEDEQAKPALQGEEDAESEYDSEGFAGFEDRARLMAMTEVERESIIYERKSRMRDKELKRKTLEQTRSVPGRTRPQKRSAASALHDIRARRSKSQRVRQSEMARVGEEDEEYEDEEEVSSEAFDESDDEFRMKGRKSKEDQRSVDKFELPVSRTLLDLKTVKELQIRRDGLEKIHAEAYFEKYVLGMFVKVSLGTSKNSGVAVYRMAEIVAFDTATSKYKFGSSYTTKKLVLAVGKDKNAIRLDMISNQSITEDEFKYWIKKMEEGKLHIVSCEEAVQRKLDALAFRKDFKYTNDDITRMIEYHKQLDSTATNLATEITDLKLKKGRLIELKQVGWEEEAAKLDFKIADLEERRKKQRRNLPSREYWNLCGLTHLS